MPDSSDDLRVHAPATPRPTPPVPDARVDAWPSARPFALTGWLERNGFRPIWTAILVLILGFLTFNVIGGIVQAVAIIPDLIASGATEPDMGDVMEVMAEHGGAVLMGNTVGQFVGFGLLAFLIVRLHTRQVGAFLRLRTPDWAAFGLAGLGWVALVPAIQWLGALNQMLPQPEWLAEFEAVQVEFIEGMLTGGDLSTFALFVALAITPALCEEVFFRGYLQRQVERKWGALASILIVGVVFGLYHLRLSQAIPLSLLGVWMGYVVWASGSLWSGVFVHLLNNGFAVLATAAIQSRPTLDLESIEAMEVPWYLGILGLLAAAGIARLLWLRRHAVVGETPDARPVAVPLPSPTPVPS